jgi:hypothetical protein
MSSARRRRLLHLTLGLAATASCSRAPSFGEGGTAGTAGSTEQVTVGGSAGEGGPSSPPPVMQPSPSHAPAAVLPPGVYLTSASATASSPSPCMAKPLGAVLDEIRASDPTLDDIQTIYNPAAAGGDGSFIYAYDVGVLGFDIVFKRGSGDCLAGCTDNEYFYFSTDASCEPMALGRYHAAWGAGAQCLQVKGTPRWTHPVPPDPLIVCGVDNSPRDVSGTYAVHASGQRMACAAGASAATLDADIQFVVEQDAADPGQGSVTFFSTGDPLVDGVKLPAHFQRQRFDAAFMSSFPPEACPRAATITAHYDFEGYQPGGIEALDFGDQSCAACKGSMSVALGDSTTVP